MFVTVFLGVLNIRSGELIYTNAAHNPPYICRASGTQEQSEVRHGPVVGPRAAEFIARLKPAWPPAR